MSLSSSSKKCKKSGPALLNTVALFGQPATRGMDVTANIGTSTSRARSPLVMWRSAEGLAPPCYLLLSSSKDCSHHAGAAPSVQHCDNPQGFFLRRVGNQVFTHHDEAQRAGSEVRALVAGAGERNKGIQLFPQSAVRQRQDCSPQ